MSVTLSAKRNFSMELCKMAAAFAVVCLHVEIPGSANQFLASLCQFANPTFFAITGYFNYRATGAQLRRRVTHILDLYITAWLFHLLYGCVITELDGGSTIAYLRSAVPDLDEIFRWFAFQQDAFLAQLWFLASTGLCYLVLWVYTRFYEDGAIRYQPLYQMGFSLFLVFFLLDVVLPVTGQTVDFYLFRNGWFFGLPFFLFGLFLHEYQQKRTHGISRRGQWLLILGGSCLCVLQVLSGTLHGFPLGAFPMVLGLMLLVTDDPVGQMLSPRAQRLVSRFGNWSTGIYLFHLTVLLAYERFLFPVTKSLLEDGEHWLRPLLIYLLSLLVAIAWDQVCRDLKTRRKKPTT